ncbi:hypothetical protein L1279_003551 [Planomicrobium sp. HSC-17F08]|nr:hypothetical protein [Planomicrobium sp. HSC-17F08]
MEKIPIGLADFRNLYTNYTKRSWNGPWNIPASLFYPIKIAFLFHQKENSY